MTTMDRLFGYRHALDHPVTRVLVLVVIAILLLSGLAIAILSRSSKVTPGLRAELWTRWRSWLILAPLMLVPVLFGAATTIFAVAILSLWCYSEFARATGLFREKLISLMVVLGILAITFSVLDNWYGLFMALSPLTICIMAAATIFEDRPKGYIQRVGLGVLGFMLFGVCLGHLGFFANDANYRPILIMLVLTVELNDVFAFIVGKTLGRRKLAPNTSPNKTMAGSLGALVLTSSLAALLAHFVWRGTPVDHWPHLIGLGLIVSAAGQLGDLLLSSVKRDLGIKDMGATIPGHGGILDRFNSLLLVSPAVFHYVGYFIGFANDQPPRIITGR